MMRSRAIAAVTAAVMLVGTMASCSQEDEGPETIKLLEYQQARADVVQKLIPQFEQAMADQGKQVKVELVTDVLTDDQFKTKISQQLHSGTAPDVIDMGGSNVTGLAGAGYLLELDDYLDDWDDWDDFYPTVKQAAVQPDGKYYSIPHEASVQSIFYRKDVLDKAGIDTSQPKTWDELITRLKKVTAKTKKPSIVIPAGTAWGGGSWSEGFLPIVASTESTFYDTESGKWKLSSDAVTATFDLYSELSRADLLPVQDLLNPNPWEPTKYKQFVDGTLPVAAQGSWGWKYDWGPEGAAPIKDVQDKVATWDYPGLLPGNQPHSISGGGYGYSVNAESESPDSAVALAQWLSSGEACAKQLVAVGSAAPRNDLTDVAPYADEQTLLDTEKKLKTAVGAPTGDGADQISQAVQQSTEQILTGKADGNQAAATFGKEAADLLGEELVQK